MEIPTLTGAIFLMATVLQPRVCFGWIPIPVVWFVMYLAAFAVAVVATGVQETERLVKLSLLVLQMVLAFWAACGILRDERYRHRVLWVLALACLVAAILPYLGVGMTAATVYTGGERVSMFGQNENRRAVILAAGLVTLIGLTYGQRFRRKWMRPLIWLACTSVTVAIVQTGSRVGLLAVGLGLLTYALGAQTLGLRLRNSIVVLVATAGVVWVTSHSQVMRGRLTSTAGIEALSGRERIFPASWGMFLERPIVGWGPVNNQYELALRLGERKHASRDTHNLVLELLSATGLVGAVTFMAGLWLCLRAAWRGRRLHEGLVVLALLATQLAASLSGNTLASNALWVAMSCALVSGARATVRVGAASGRPGYPAAGGARS